jgi:hypothetical protein
VYWPLPWFCLRKLTVAGMAVAVDMVVMVVMAVMVMAAITVVLATIGWPLCWVQRLWAA